LLSPQIIVRVVFKNSQGLAIWRIFGLNHS
jgi:hypothetical protein